MRHPLVPVALIMALLILMGEGFFSLFSNLRDPSRSASHYSHFVKESNWMLVDVSDLPSHRERSFRVPAEVVEIADDSSTASRPCHGKILLYLSPSDSLPSIGDRLLVHLRPSLPSAADNPHQFDYRKLLRRRGILYSAYVPSGSYRIVSHSNRGFKAAFASLRLKIINILLSSGLSPDERGIAEALLLGWDDDLSPETKLSFKAAGISHLLCVSGLHVGIVALLVGYSLFFLSNRRSHRIIKGCIQLVAIWFFVVLTGMAPGTLRAGFMFSLVVLGKMFFSRPPTVNAIAASAVILLAVNPLLLFDAGFQLSYSSVSAIVLLTPHLQSIIPIPDGTSLLSKIPLYLLKRLRDLVCVSLAAQAATTPLILYYFHQFPLYFLVANIIVIPFAALLLGSILLMTLLSWWPALFKLLGIVVSAELSATSSLTSFVASWPNAVIGNIYFDLTMLCISAAIVIVASAALIRRRLPLLTVAIALTLPLAIYCRMVEKRCAGQHEFVVYNIGNRTAIEFFFGHDSYLLCDSIIARNPKSIDYHTANNLIWHKASRKHILTLDTSFNNDTLFIDKRFVAFDDISMRIIDRSNYRQQSPYPAKLDYLLLRESPYISISQLRERYDFDTLIISSQNSPRRRLTWQRQCDSLGVPVR